MASLTIHYIFLCTFNVVFPLNVSLKDPDRILAAFKCHHHTVTLLLSFHAVSM